MGGGGGGGKTICLPPPPIFSWGGGGCPPAPPPRIDASVWCHVQLRLYQSGELLLKYFQSLFSEVLVCESIYYGVNNKIERCPIS